MAEIKNSFLKSKMNKDLDDRLIPNGEYRDAQNISVGKSEDDDVGALENVRGNTIENTGAPTDAGLEVIGHFEDINNSRLFLFYTDYDDGNPYLPGYEPTYAPSTAKCYIYSFENDVFELRVQGSFLNLSKSNPITGVNLVENLLFWTDNRNQPRKINVSKSSSYYFLENHISVAKYNPYEPLTLLKKVEITGVVSAASSATITGLTAAQTSSIALGMSLVSKTSAGVSKILATDYLYVLSKTSTTIVLSAVPSGQILNTDDLTFLETTMTGKDITYDFNDSAPWPGDPDFLENLFVRFSYRFKFDDNEYSLMAPFTQPAFIPHQKGYFLSGDEDAAYRSTILKFMQNGVQNVELIIPLPDVESNIGSQNLDTYKIIEIDVLYKEADARAIKVLDTVTLSDTGALNSKTYQYQSRKPYKTLPERQTVRVYDKVPVRALAQEVSGNRVMYGNFQSQHTSPLNLNYNVGANAKNTTIFNNWIEYPNHTLKQNRNYQVGFVLSDKFGRQSSVVLSSVDALGQNVGGSFLGGSTFYHPYKSTTQNLLHWFGDALKVVINTSIPNDVNYVNGRPGLYAKAEGNGFNISVLTAINSAVTVPTLGGDGFLYHFTVTGSVTNVPAVGEYLRGEFADFVKVIKIESLAGQVYKVYTREKINDIIYSQTVLNPDTKFAYTLPNPLGWYSYKIVVKQQEQEYYNCYFPGYLNGYPTQASPVTFPTNENNKTGHVVLLNDNINKVPRDLNETSDQQKQFRSSVQLFNRVNNTATSNLQYFPVALSGTQILPLGMTADTIATAGELHMAFDDITSDDNFYQLDTNPFISRLATLNVGTTNVGVTAANTMIPFLSVAETEPTETLLELFYETSTAGLIADLNADIETGFDGVSGLSALSYNQTEAMQTGTFITAVWYAQNNQGSNFSNTGFASGYPIMKVTNAPGTVITNKFTLVTSGTGYRIKTAVEDFVFGPDGSTKEKYTFRFDWKTTAGDESFTENLVSLTNTDPEFAIALVAGNLPNITVSVDDGNSVSSPIVTRNAFNGSFSDSAVGMKYSISPASTGSSFFSIESTSGKIFKSPSTPIGVYTLNIKIEDAVTGGNVQAGSKTITKTQQITVGYDPLNSEAISGCTTVGSPGLAGLFFSSVPRPGANDTKTAVWYVAANALTNSDLPVTPSAPLTGSFASNYLHRLGTGAVTLGTIVFQCVLQQRFSNNSGGSSFSTGGTQWKIWRRPVGGSQASWSQIADVNNDNMGAPGITLASINTTINSTLFKEIAVAFNQVGEYCVAAIDLTTTQAQADTDCIVAYVNSNDLNYSTCVVEDGVNVVDTNTPRRYQYNVSGATSAYSCSIGNTSRFSPIPYANYVDALYINSTLTSIYKPSSAEYYNFSTNSSNEPFSSINGSAKFGTDGLKMSPNLLSDPCADMFFRACSGSNPTCAHPIS